MVDVIILTDQSNEKILELNLKLTRLGYNVLMEYDMQDDSFLYSISEGKVVSVFAFYRRYTSKFFKNLNMIIAKTNRPITLVAIADKLSRKLRKYPNHVLHTNFNEHSLRYAIKAKKTVANPVAKNQFLPLEGTIPLSKRIFDIVIASTLLLVLSPLFLLVSVLIKLESRGPVFYAAKRVGQNYQIFNFIKFRSMRVNADSMIQSLKNQSQYHRQEKALTAAESKSEAILLSDSGFVNEEAPSDSSSAFIKIANDPRITRIGKFIRNTSIDELPQLINVLRGDMSIVGNRPLPLYEAEQLTTDEAILRFIAPAGITGLWQVTDRGKTDVSSSNRIYLDTEYSMNYNFWLDLKILWKTLPAAIQQDNV